MISKMISDEKPVKPLSDDAIAKNISKKESNSPGEQLQNTGKY